MLRDQSSGANYLVEHDIHSNSRQVVRTPLTSIGDPILPETVHYSPDGRYICYARDTGGRRELWMIDSDRGESDGVMLTAGSLGPHTAFSPDGRYLAISMREPHSSEVEVSLIDVAMKQVVEPLGPGQLGKEPWHPSGKYVLITDAGESDANQIWAVATSSPYLRVQLTDLPRGVAPGCAVSRCGRWAAGMAAAAEKPTLVFVDLRSASSSHEDKAARALLRS